MRPDTELTLTIQPFRASRILGRIAFYAPHGPEVIRVHCGEERFHWQLLNAPVPLHAGVVDEGVYRLTDASKTNSNRIIRIDVERANLDRQALTRRDLSELWSADRAAHGSEYCMSRPSQFQRGRESYTRTGACNHHVCHCGPPREESLELNTTPAPALSKRRLCALPAINAVVYNVLSSERIVGHSEKGRFWRRECWCTGHDIGQYR